MKKPSRAAVLSILVLLSLLPYLDGSFPQAQSPRQKLTKSVESARNSGIPDSVLNHILTLCVDHQLPATDVVVLLETIRSVGLENLPLDPFVVKIDEGLAKKAAASAIAATLERKIDDYRFVRKLLLLKMSKRADRSVSDDDLITVAGSLDTGISREELAVFIEQAPAAPPAMVAIAVENLALLNQIGFRQDLALQMLYSGLRYKRLSPSWRYLARVIVVARNRGISEQIIADATTKALAENSNLKDLMTSLGFTGRDLRHGPATGRPRGSGR